MNADGLSAIRDPLQRLLARIPQEHHPNLGQAYHIAYASHEDQSRDAGQPYIIHPIAVALILAQEMGFSHDADMMAAALLHDAVEDSALNLEEIEPTFGPAVTALVRGVTKAEPGQKANRAARRAATLQKLFSSAREDSRVLVLKLADRLHNMRTIEGIGDPKRRRRIAQETIDIYAPISHLLGMSRTRRELENRSFTCLEPDADRQMLVEMAAGPSPECLAFADHIAEIVRRQGIRTRVRIQPKSLPSIHRKMTLSGAPLDHVYDRYAIEVIVSSRDACYRTLGFLHARFAPVMESFKDFVALPKRNRYQALHTTVIDSGRRYEVHIQTPAMHRMGELGVAALKSGRLQEETRRRWLEEMADWHDQDAPSHQLLNELKRILFTREIATFTPDGDPIVLPEGATVLDFAFAVHTDLGMRCSSATINGRPSSPFSVLAWGDTVRIETSPDKEPRQHWLRHVRSFRARKIIARHLHRIDDGLESSPS